MAHTHTQPCPHAEVRHRSQTPMPAVDDGEQPWAAWLTPLWLAPRQLERGDPRPPPRRMRQRRLTRPVMVASVVSLVGRRIPALTEVHTVLTREGVWWSRESRVIWGADHV